MDTNFPQVYAAINAVQVDIAKTGIGKDNTTTGGARFKFRGIDDVYNALSPIMAKHGLVVLPTFTDRVVDERIAKSGGGAVYYVTVTGHFDFVSIADGSVHKVTTFGEAMDSGDKGTNKAMSIAQKYAFLQVFAIPTEGDNDPDGYTHPPSQPSQQNQQAPQPMRDVSPVKQALPKIGDIPQRPAPLDAIAFTSTEGKSYTENKQRVFRAEQFVELEASLISGNLPISKFYDNTKYFFGQEQLNALMFLEQNL